MSKEEIGAALEALGLESQEDGNYSRFTQDGHTMVVFVNDEVSFHGTRYKPRTISASFSVEIRELEKRGRLQATLSLLLDEVRLILARIAESTGWIENGPGLDTITAESPEPAQEPPPYVPVDCLYDPPSGWMYGFPKPWPNNLPFTTENLEKQLVADGYPRKMAKDLGKGTRLLITKEEP